MTGSEFVQRGYRFQKELQSLRKQKPEVPWYPYETLRYLPVLEKLFAAKDAPSFDRLLNGRVADVGCGDGDLGFLFESAGCRVDAIDNPPTNFNGMRGVETLKHALRSSVEIYQADLDSQFFLPAVQYNLTLFLGILYHLKNPYYALERLARTSRYALVSTRVARFGVDGRTPIDSLPVAWLLDERETNNDATNFWIFSPAGLRRILTRTGWAILASEHTGNADRSNPAGSDADERIHCLLESTYARSFDSAVSLIHGWHEPESGGWRWTERRFSVALAPADSTRVLELQIEIPEALTERLGEIRLGSDRWAAAGSYIHRVAVPAHAREVHFELDRALPAGEIDARELGVIVSGIQIKISS